MKLQEIFDQLSSSEFSQLSIGGSDAGVIDENNYAKVIPHINLALTALHKRFALKEGRVTVRLIDGQDTYRLRSEFSVNSTRFPVDQRYIVDTPSNRFLDDILKVDQVFTDGQAMSKPLELDLNKPGNTFSVHTPSATMLRVPRALVTSSLECPEELKTATLELVYRADHPKIQMPPLACDPQRIDVDLPHTYLEPLLYFVASRVYNPVGMTNEFNAGNTYYTKYEAACLDIEMGGLNIKKDESTDRLRQKGWV